MKLATRFICLGALVAAWVTLSGCSASITTRSVQDDKFLNTKGVPWVETSLYDVYIFQGISDKKVKQIYYGRHALIDKVNGTIIDPSRPRWVTNYKAGSFSNASLKLVFHQNGSLKEAHITTTPKAAEAAKAATAALSVTEEIEKKELERLKRQKELSEVQKALDKAESQ